jgi:hypothetical protein
MIKILRHIVASLAMVIAFASCTKDSLVFNDSDVFIERPSKTADANDADGGAEDAQALPATMPSTADDSGDNGGSSSSGNISDDDDDESDDDASVKRSAQNK